MVILQKGIKIRIGTGKIKQANKRVSRKFEKY